MFKKIFKAAKDLVRSPVGQIGIGLLLPGMAGMSGLAGGIGRFAAANPMLTQAGVGLLAGDKPENVLRNVAYGTALGGISNLGQPGGFMGGARQSLGMTPTTAEMAGSFKGPPSQTMNTTDTIAQEVVKDPSLLERSGLIKTSRIITNPDGSQSIVPVTDFFEKYSPLLKLGAVGATIASAAIADDEQEKLLYDPTKNPYLKSGSGDKDFYEDINPYYAASMNQGGVMDFPEKDGMIDGPGDGQSDDIPAMLSDGEFVMTKQAVMAAGNGDREQGTKQMYDMMYSLENKAENMGIGRV
jgi:hypothetical protein